MTFELGLEGRGRMDRWDKCPRTGRGCWSQEESPVTVKAPWEPAAINGLALLPGNPVKDVSNSEISPPLDFSLA